MLMLLLVLDSSQRLGIVEGVVAKHTLMLRMLMIDDDLILGVVLFVAVLFLLLLDLFASNGKSARNRQRKKNRLDRRQALDRVRISHNDLRAKQPAREQGNTGSPRP